MRRDLNDCRETKERCPDERKNWHLPRFLRPYHERPSGYPRQGLELFDTVIIAIAYNIEKQGLFTIEERKELIRQSVKGNGNIIIDSFQGFSPIT